MTVRAENLNDLWNLFNVIDKDDLVSGKTKRKVVLKDGNKGDRIPMWLKLKVEDVSFHEFTNRLRIRGKILEGPSDLVSYGSYHTFNLEVFHVITITKENWLNSDIKRLKEVSKFESEFKILVIAMEPGLASIDLISNYSQARIASVKGSIPGKRYEQSHRNKALTEFFDDVKKVLEENLKNIQINAIAICGPGSTRDDFITYLKESSKPEYLNKIKSYHGSSGTESAILELLKSKQLSELKKNMKILEETDRIEDLLAQLSIDADLVVIGFDEVTKAATAGAIKQLFVADVLIRGVSKEKKLQIEEVITNAENGGARVDILSSEHPTGQQIIDLGSLVAILRYKLTK